mgnify:CR=1 FL=1
MRARLRGDPGRFLDEVSRTVRAINRDLSIVDLRTVNALHEEALARRRGPAAALTLVTGWDYFRKSLPYLRDEA